MTPLTPAAIAHVTAQIRARYIGQPVIYPFTTPTGIKEDRQAILTGITHEYSELRFVYGHVQLPSKGHLSLRGIESLTDEEYTMIASLLFPRMKVESPFLSRMVHIGRAYMTKHTGYVGKVFFYLLSLGIALPQSVMLPDGEFITVRIQEQINYGIIKTR